MFSLLRYSTCPRKTCSNWKQSTPTKNFLGQVSPLTSRSIAEQSRLSERSVRYALAALKEAGYVREYPQLDDMRMRTYAVARGT